MVGQIVAHGRCINGFVAFRKGHHGRKNQAVGMPKKVLGLDVFADENQLAFIDENGAQNRLLRQDILGLHAQFIYCYQNLTSLLITFFTRLP